jgi:cell division protein FtsQ
VLVLLAVGAAAVLGWRWHRSIPVRQVVVTGATHAVPDSLVRLARAEIGQALYRLQPRLVADRVERHPWVEHAEAARHPDGTLRITVVERTPAALVVQDGEAAYYLDAAGYPLSMPGGGAAFDVPLVRGLDEAAQPHQPHRPTGHAALRRLLSALRDDASADALVSEIRVGEGVRLRTVPDGRGRSAEVRLGAGAFAQKLRRLTAFWQQAVREAPHTAFHRIDLRFDGQIVARQHPFSPPSTLTP